MCLGADAALVVRAFKPLPHHREELLLDAITKTWYADLKGVVKALHTCVGCSSIAYCLRHAWLQVS